MKRFVIPIVILLILGFVGVSQADTLSVAVSRWSIGGGEVTTGENYKLSTIAGQPLAGSQSGGEFDLKWGFWQPPAINGTIFLPMVAKPDQGPSSNSNLNDDGSRLP